MDSELKKNWLVWNLANIISCSRLIVPFVFFWPNFLWLNLNVNDKLFFALILMCTDFLDGFLARKVGNSKGIGVRIDPSVDKIAALSFLVFFYMNNLVDYRFLLPIGIIEVVTVLVFWLMCEQVNNFGKVKMICYFLGITAVYVDCVYGLGVYSEEIIKIIFASGITVAAIALLFYISGELKVTIRKILDEDM